MKADAVPLLNLFEKKMRLEVPLFQRQYVWNQEEQWEPLWEDIQDIQRKFDPPPRRLERLTDVGGEPYVGRVHAC